MSYIDKYAKIRPYVKLNIPWNKQKFTKSEKALITQYYNKLKHLGYFNREQEGYTLKNISRSKYKVKGAPKIKQAVVQVGTKIKDGKIVTDKNAKIKIRNGKIYVRRHGRIDKWRFEYNINRDWKLEDFKKHLLKQMGQKEIRKDQIFAIGAGNYVMRGTKTNALDSLAKKILAIANHYKQQNEEIDEDDDETPIKKYWDFMQEVVVYEGKDALNYYSDKKFKRRKKSKYEKRRMR